MSFFDSPIEFCPLTARYVLLDQSCAQCRRENGCLNPSCPLEPWFSRNPLGARPSLLVTPPTGAAAASADDPDNT